MKIRDRKKRPERRHDTHTKKHYTRTLDISPIAEKKNCQKKGLKQTIQNIGSEQKNGVQA